VAGASSHNQWDCVEEFKSTLTKDDILAEIQSMQNRGADLEEYRELLGNLTEQWIYLANMWTDTRPGTEREKESRWTQDVGGGHVHGSRLLLLTDN
jgi:hypothetical protein